MGHNLISGCHKCKVKIFHYRNEETETIRPFYVLHKSCIEEDITNVVTILDNMNFQPQWLDIYKDITEI